MTLSPLLYDKRHALILTRYLHFYPVIYASFCWKWTNYSRSCPTRLKTGQKDLSECDLPSLKCDLSQGCRGQRLKVMRRMKRCYLTALLSLFVSIEPLAGPCLSTSKHWPNIVCQPWPLACCYAASFTQECVCVCVCVLVEIDSGQRQSRNLLCHPLPDQQ